MKDFDFDELDRAVSSALSGNSKGPSSASVSPAQSRSTAPSSTVTTAPTGETVLTLEGVAPEPFLGVAPEPKAETPVARRPTGRFMDIVHTSSDMRPTAGPVARPVSPTPMAPVQPVAEGSTTENEVLAAVPEAPVEEGAAPLESPFLPDAKVEKRPLGGPALLSQPDEPRLEAPDELQLAAPEEPPVEEVALADPLDFYKSSVEQAAEPEAPVTEQLPAASESPADFIDIDATVESEEAYTGPTSITQQYQEKEEVPAESGAIYDTETYHQPIAAATKKKSGLRGIVWVLVLAGVGAALGAGFYFFVLPLL